MVKKIILASTSPRRKEILSLTGLTFETQESDYKEDMTLKMAPGKLVEFLSKGKAQAISQKNPDAIIIAGDTIVVYKNKVFGKPKDAKEAQKTLEMLSGKKHYIITGATIIDTKTGKSTSFHETTKVYMKKLSKETIEKYIQTGEPLDKAGSYAIQGKGFALIKKINGDFFSAEGLPISRLADELKNFSINIY